MEKISNYLIVRCSLIAVLFCGLLMCVLWYPFTISLTVVDLSGKTPDLIQNISFFTQLAFYWSVSIPCIICLWFLWKATKYMKNDEIFTTEAAHQIKICSKILLVDLWIFLIGNIVFLCLEWNDFFIIYLVIFIIGLVVFSLLKVLHRYMLEVSSLKEEVEGTI